MSEYTPTTAEVREEFVYGHQEVDMRGNVVVSFDEANVRWDRWLAKVERAAAERAWGEGHIAGRDYQGDGWNQDAHDPSEDNPYRAAALGLTAGQDGENDE